MGKFVNLIKGIDLSGDLVNEMFVKCYRFKYLCIYVYIY